MNWQDKRVKILVTVLVIILAIIGFRIVNNLLAARERATRATLGGVVAVPLERVQRKTLNAKLTFAGNLEPGWQAEFGPKIAGRINEILVAEGDFVKRGTVLAVLENTEMSGTVNSLLGNVYDAKAALEQAETTLNRAESLYQAGAQSKQELDNALYARDMARGKLLSVEGAYAAGQAKIEGSVLTAPHDGYVLKRLHQEGYYIGAGETLFQLADISTLLVKVNIPEGQIGEISNGATAFITVPALHNKTVMGTITKLATVADLPARTFAAEITIDNALEELKGGLYASVEVELAPRSNALVIPAAAIVMREDQRTVYVVNENNVAQRRILTTGYIGEGDVEVVAGLDEGEVVIVGGQNKLREGSKIKSDEDSAK
ncbi:MAG TPA: efflux RND transporter periplasmic adaptor subunit [Candidatus Avacidaminococcus intestinavium]|uniref:Efflux RND transporter periplasmic adaptor subunit n=1 Tax=Candidatus Avacidaminococcus intestinavium TaxID=2840684 RepID=A0A9D1SL85_9FIRM|nr:efflux RND transporter periplasmic adaptor subunit [Candidatus Avacidaminococcus intestinavium]